MIDANALKDLVEVDQNVACLVTKGIAFIHSTVFVLELPEKEVKKLKWPGEVIPHIPTWRTQVPQHSLVKTTAMRESAPNGKACMQLMSLTTDDARYMRLAYYEFFQEQLDNPSYKIMLVTPPNPLSGIAVFDNDQWVGAIGAYRGLSDDG